MYFKNINKLILKKFFLYSPFDTEYARVVNSPVNHNMKNESAPPITDLKYPRLNE